MENLYDTSTITILCKIKAIREGQYTEYVVEDLNREFTDDLKYVTIVKLPNWDPVYFNIGDCGYLQFKSVVGGKSQWCNHKTQETGTYCYTNNYYIGFIKTEDICKTEKFKF